MSNLTIGERIRQRRQLSGRSLRQVASDAGISHAALSLIERGLRGADNRNILADIARALGCSVPDLTGRPGELTTTDDVRLARYVDGLLAALVETDLDDEATVAPVALDKLAYDAGIVDDLQARADYAGAAAHLGGLLRGLHATAVTVTGAEERTLALRLTVLGSIRAGGVLREVGRRAEAYLAADRAFAAAELLDDPVMLASAQRSRATAAMSCGSASRALKLAATGLHTIDGHLDVYSAKEIAGHLHLISAATLYGLHRREEADVHLAEAEALAALTGDSEAMRLYFGPTNLRFWKLAITIDCGDPREAVRIAQTTTPSAITSIDRQAMFYLDAARALSAIGTREADASALRMLGVGERIAPQKIRHNPFAKEVLRMVLERAKRSTVDGKLRGLAERIGVNT